MESGRNGFCKRPTQELPPSPDVKIMISTSCFPRRESYQDQQGISPYFQCVPIASSERGYLFSSGVSSWWEVTVLWVYSENVVPKTLLEYKWLFYSCFVPHTPGACNIFSQSAITSDLPSYWNKTLIALGLGSPSVMRSNGNPAQLSGIKKGFGLPFS